MQPLYTVGSAVAFSVYKLVIDLEEAFLSSSAKVLTVTLHYIPFIIIR